MKKVAFYTFGCKLNYAETSTLSRMFAERGYREVDFTDTPDIFVINSCSVTDNADKKCKKIIKEAKRISPNSYVTVIGCYAQLKSKEISEFSEVDAVLGTTEKFRLFDYIGDFSKRGEFVSAIQEAKEFKAAHSISGRTRAFIKVQDGCNYKCTFCTIPLARGKSRSCDVDDILWQVRKIVQSEIKEIVLTGVNIGDFGIIKNKKKVKLINLLKALEQEKGEFRIRISSIEPNLLTHEIIDFVAQSNRFVPHFHIPLQSGSNKILKLMNRCYQRELYQNRVAYIKSVMPNSFIGADVICGFPDETQKDFMDTYLFINELDISCLHVFPFSERQDTPAARMPGKVTQFEKENRSKQLRTLSNQKKRKFYLQQLGKERTVLFESHKPNGKIEGFTENYIKVTTHYHPLLNNELIHVKLTNINENGLMEVASSVLTSSN